MNCYIHYPAGVPCLRCRDELVYPDVGDGVCGSCRMREITDAFLDDLRAGLRDAFASVASHTPGGTE